MARSRATKAPPVLARESAIQRSLLSRSEAAQRLGSPRRDARDEAEAEAEAGKVQGRGLTYDFSKIRIHADDEADALAGDLGAAAFTHGRDIYFRGGAWKPGTTAGNHLLAHELAHVQQQERSGHQVVQCSPETDVQAELDRPVGANDTAAQAKRIADLSATFNAMSIGEASALLKRLSARAPGDELAAAFHDRLSTSSRRTLQGILQRREVAVSYSHHTNPRDDLKYIEATARPAPSGTTFHPGVMHDHKPTGKWTEVQANPNSEVGLNTICRHSDPEAVMLAAGLAGLRDKPLAAEHINWFYRGGGANFDEYSNLESMLRTDSGVQKKILSRVPASQSSGKFADFVAVTQDDYADEDFQYSFGEIDRLDFEVDFDAGTIHAWFQDRYEWHPVYPIYPKSDGDYVRPTNCVHAAAVELKAGSARDYWMKGEVTIPLKAIKSTVERWHAPKPVY